MRHLRAPESGCIPLLGALPGKLHAPKLRAIELLRVLQQRCVTPGADIRQDGVYRRVHILLRPCLPPEDILRPQGVELFNGNHPLVTSVSFSTRVSISLRLN